MRNRRNRSRLMPGETGDANRLWTAKSVGRAPLAQGNPVVTRHLTITDANGNVVGYFDGPAGVASFGNLQLGTISSDNVVTFGRSTINQFIDYTNGDDANDGLMPKATTEDFTRASAAWDASTATDGLHSWTMLTGTAANLTTVTGAPGYGKMVLPASVSYDMALQCGGLFEEQFWQFQADKVPTAGVLNLFIYHRLRNNGAWATNQNGYRFRCQVAAGGGVPTILGQSVVASAAVNVTGTGTAVDANVFVVNVDWNVRTQVYYNYLTQQTTMRGKIWKSTATEPVAWDCTGTDSNNELTWRAGQCGLGGNTGAITNPNITVRFSHFSYHLLDPDLLAADDTTTGVADTTYYYAPTSTGPVATLGKALRSIQNYNQTQNFLQYHNGNDLPVESNTHIDGFVGGGQMYITGANPTITGSLSFNGNSSLIHVDGLTFTDPGGGVGGDAGGTMAVQASRWIELMNLRLHGNSNVGQNVYATNGSVVQLINCQLNGNVSFGLLADQASTVFAWNNTGAGTVNSYKSNAAIIYSTGSQPTGVNAVGFGGKIFVTATADAPTSTAAGTAAPTSTKKTKLWTSSAGSTYGMSYGTWAGGSVVQGVYGGSQNHKGMWKWPGGVQSTLAAKTIDQAYIYITRLSYGGASQAQNIYLFSANTAAFTSSPGVTSGPTLLGSLAWGQSKWFKVPIGIANDLKTAVGGNTRLLGLFQGDGTPYVICSVNARLKITYH